MSSSQNQLLKMVAQIVKAQSHLEWTALLTGIAPNQKLKTSTWVSLKQNQRRFSQNFTIIRQIHRKRWAKSLLIGCLPNRSRLSFAMTLITDASRCLNLLFLVAFVRREISARQDQKFPKTTPHTVNIKILNVPIQKTKMWDLRPRVHFPR